MKKTQSSVTAQEIAFARAFESERKAEFIFFLPVSPPASPLRA
jgi:hypothetical protein